MTFSGGMFVNLGAMLNNSSFREQRWLFDRLPLTVKTSREKKDIRTRIEKWANIKIFFYILMKLDDMRFPHSLSLASLLLKSLLVTLV